jgi:two-component system, OmpR family, phosphate regulon sensor histidine kinase PhoR
MLTAADLRRPPSAAAAVGFHSIVELVAEAAPDALIVVDARGRMTLVNAQMEHLFGYPRGELLGQSVEILVPARLRSSHARLRSTYLDDPTMRPMGNGLPLFGRRKDGSEFPAEISLAPLATDDGTLTIAIIRDVSERQRIDDERIKLLARAQQARAEAERAIAVRDQVLAAVSHDLKAPLTVISGRAQLLAKQLQRMNGAQSREHVESLREIHASTQRMRVWIDELVDVARLQVGQELRLNRAQTDLVALARQAAVEYQANGERHQLRVEAAEPVLVGDWDAERLHRVLANLVSNAIKYSPDGGEVTIHVKRDDGMAVVAVRDCGVGVPPADLPHLFEQFHRAGNVVGRIAGTGIGLAVSRHIVEQHGGTIEVDTLEGVGSTFTVRLPLSSVGDTRRPSAGGMRDTPASA